MTLDGQAASSLRAGPLSKQVYEILRDHLIRGTLKPGQRLLVNDLAAQLGVSVTPVRDALRLLSGDGWVEIIPRRGTFVSRCTKEDVREVFEIRTIVECAAVEGATEATAGFLDELEKLVREMERIYLLDDDGRIREYGRYINSDSEFHCRIVSLLDNERITDFYEQLRWPTQVLRGLSYANYERAADTVGEHAAILEALKQGDTSKAKAAIRDHLNGAEAEILEHLSGDD